MSEKHSNTSGVIPEQKLHTRCFAAPHKPCSSEPYYLKAGSNSNQNSKMPKVEINYVAPRSCVI